MWRKFRFLAPLVLLAAGACGSELKGERMDGKLGPDGTPIEEYQSLSITNPKDGDYYPSQLVVVQGYSEVDGEILVNGESTTAEGGMFSHTIRIQEEGAHQITVSVPETGAERTIEITLDTTSPKFTLKSPEPGSFIEGTAIPIEGHVDDANIDFITINNRDYGVQADGSFVGEATVERGAHHWRIEAVDLAGNVSPGSVSFIAGTFSTNGARTHEAVTIELGTNMVNTLATGIRNGITKAGIRSALLANNPVVNDWFGRVDLTGYSHSGVAISVVPKEGYLNVAVSIGGVAVPFSFVPAINGASAVKGTASARAVSVTGRVDVGVSKAGLPTVQIRNVNTTLVGFSIDLSKWPEQVDDLVTSTLRGTIQDAITDLLTNEVPPAVREALAGLPADAPIEAFGHKGQASGRLSELAISEAGLFAVVDLGIQASSPIESLAAKSGPFLMGHDTPTRTGTPQAHARVALDLVNRVAHAAWTTGAGEFTIEEPVLTNNEGVETEITVGSLALLFPSIKGMAGDEQSVDVELSTALPPIIDGSGESVAIVAPDVRATLIAKDGDKRTKLFTLSVLAQAKVDFMFANNTIRVSISNYQIEIDAFGEVPDGFKSGEELQTLFSKLLAPRIEPFLDLGAFKIPEITGFELDAEQVVVQGGYIEASGRLVAQ